MIKIFQLTRWASPAVATSSVSAMLTSAALLLLGLSPTVSYGQEQPSDLREWVEALGYQPSVSSSSLSPAATAASSVRLPRPSFPNPYINVSYGLLETNRGNF